MMLCRYPIYLKDAKGIVPCGRCLHCRQNTRKKKTTRAVLESKMHEHCLFVTLTYDNDSLPREYTNPNTGEYFSHPDGVLDPTSLQLFLKRLRRALPPKSLRFFAVGEYGDNTFRPHYHILFWGLPWEKRDIIRRCWSDPVTKIGYCHPDRLDVQIPQKDWDVAQYVSGYTMKKMTRSDDPRLAGRTPEFFRSSQGLGAPSVSGLARTLDQLSSRAYIETHGDIPRNLVINGKTMPLDRYMRGKVLDALQITEKAMAIGREKFAQEMSDLRGRAASNPEIPKNWLQDKTRVGWALENQFKSEKAQEMNVAEKRAEFFERGKSKL